MSDLLSVPPMTESAACVEASVSASQGVDSPFRQAIAMAQAACDAAAASSSPTPVREDAGLPPLSGSTADAKTYWNEDRYVSASQLAAYCEPWVRSRFALKDDAQAASSEAGRVRHEEMLRR